MHTLPTDLGSWLGLVALLIAAAVGIKKLMERRKPEEEFITRGEFSKELSKLSLAVGECLTKKDFGDFKTLLERQQEKIETKLDANSARTERLLALMEYVHLAKKLTDQPGGGIVTNG